MTTRKFFIVLLISAAACGDSLESRRAAAVVIDTLPGGAVRTMSSAPVDSGRWSLTLLHDIQPEEGSAGELMRPTAVVVTDNGTLLVVEESPLHIKVFSPDGEYLRAIGQKGAGPGEFQSVWIATRGDTLFAHDPSLGRGSIFLISTGEFLATHRTACCYWAPIEIDAAGRAVVPSIDSPRDTSRGPAQVFVRVGLSSGVTDTVNVWYRSTDSKDRYWDIYNGDLLQGRMQVPLQPRDVQLTDPKGAFVTAWTGDYLLRATSDGADTVQLYGRTFTPSQVSSGEKRALADAKIQSLPPSMRGANMRLMFNPDFIPNVHPPFEHFSIDRAGRTWIRRSLADTSVVELDLFGEDRVWLDVIRVPSSDWPGTASWSGAGWGRDRVAMPVEDEDGLPLVRVFEVVRGGR